MSRENNDQLVVTKLRQGSTSSVLVHSTMCTLNDVLRLVCTITSTCSLMKRRVTQLKLMTGKFQVDRRQVADSSRFGFSAQILASEARNTLADIVCVRDNS